MKNSRSGRTVGDSSFLPLRLCSGYPYFVGFAHLASGLANGLSGLAAGICIGIVGDAGVRATAQQPKVFVGK